MGQRSKRVAFILAHQDDEYFMSTRIAREVGGGHRVQVVFLTDGGIGGDPRVRDAESRRMLSELGVDPGEVHCVGSKLRIPDGALHEHLDRALEGLEGVLGPGPADRIFAAAYEGGHQDHDAAYLVALAYGRPHAVWQIPLYNAYATSWKFHRVGRPLPTPGRRFERELAGEAPLRHALLARFYPSQWKAMLGLVPARVLRLLALRRETLIPALPLLPPRRPHDGPLLYERRTGLSFERFSAAVEPFLASKLGIGPAAS